MKNGILLFLKHYWKTILVVAFIFYVSIIRIPSEVKMVFPFFNFPHFDKFVHACIYFLLGSAIYADFVRHLALKKIAIFCRIAIFPALYGGVIELLQAYCFPPRTGDWLDFLANAIGAFFAWILFSFLIKKKKSN